MNTNLQVAFDVVSSREKRRQEAVPGFKSDRQSPPVPHRTVRIMYIMLNKVLWTLDAYT